MDDKDITEEILLLHCKKSCFKKMTKSYANIANHQILYLHPLEDQKTKKYVFCITYSFDHFFEQYLLNTYPRLGQILCQTKTRLQKSTENIRIEMER